MCISSRTSCGDHISVHYSLKCVKIYNKWQVYPYKYPPGLNQIKCWFKPNVCNKSISYFWMCACWRLQHDDIVLCVIASVWGHSASSCLLPLSRRVANPAKSSFHLFSFCGGANSLPLPGQTHQATVRENLHRFHFTFQGSHPRMLQSLWLSCCSHVHRKHTEKKHK